MASVDATLEDIVRKKILQAIQDETQNLVNGMAGDYADYRYRVGTLKGLSNALDCIQAGRETIYGK